MMEYDDVNCPAHYCQGRKYYPADVAEDWGLDGDAYVFTAFKYISRYERKEDAIKDLKKAVWYLQRRIKTLESQSSSATASIPHTRVNEDGVGRNAESSP